MKCKKNRQKKMNNIVNCPVQKSILICPMPTKKLNRKKKTSLKQPQRLMKRKVRGRKRRHKADARLMEQNNIVQQASEGSTVLQSEQGLQGSVGNPGPLGIAGLPGPQGPLGANGLTGAAAYFYGAPQTLDSSNPSPLLVELVNNGMITLSPDNRSLIMTGTGLYYIAASWKVEFEPTETTRIILLVNGNPIQYFNYTAWRSPPSVNELRALLALETGDTLTFISQDSSSPYSIISEEMGNFDDFNVPTQALNIFVSKHS